VLNFIIHILGEIVRNNEVKEEVLKDAGVAAKTPED